MTYFLFFSAIIIGLMFHKSKIVSGYILSCMYMLAAFNYKNADYYSYTISYRNSASLNQGFRYVGYTFFTHLFSSRGIPYEQYLKIIFVFILAIIFISVRALTKKPNLVLSLFTIFSFGMDVIQIKAFTSEAMSLLSIVIMFKALSIEYPLRRRNELYIVSFVLAILAGLMHYSALYYLAVEIVFITVKNRNNIRRRILILLAALSFLLYSGLLPFVLRFGEQVGLISDMDYLSQWGLKSTHFGFLITFVGVFLLLIAILNKDDEPTDSMCQLLMRQFLFTAALLFPLLIMNWAYDRLIRVYTIILYAYFANKKISTVITVKQAGSLLAFLAMVGYMFYIDIFGSYEGTLGAILNYSTLFR